MKSDEMLEMVYKMQKAGKIDILKTIKNWFRRIKCLKWIC
jgi:hypothetical protein